MTPRKKPEPLPVVPLPAITGTAAGAIVRTGSATASTGDGRDPHMLAAVRAWLDGAAETDPDREHDGGTALVTALGAELSARLRAHLNTPATDPLFFGARGYRAIVEDWRLFRDDTPRAVRDTFFVDVELIAGVGAYAANAAVESWKQHGLRAAFDPRVAEGWGLPATFPDTEVKALITGARALHADIVTRTLAYHTTGDIPPALVGTAFGGNGPEFEAAWGDSIRAGTAFLRPDYAEETALLAAHIPTFRVALARVRDTIARDSYTDDETRALVDLVAPRWTVLHGNTWDDKRGWMGDGLTFWAVGEHRAIGAARLAEAIREKAEAEHRAREAEAQLAEERAQHVPRRLSLGPGTVKQHTRQTAEYHRMIRALRKNNEIDDDEAKLFLDLDPNPLRGDAMLAAAAMLTVAQQSGALRDLQAATVRVGKVQLDARIAIPRLSLEQLGRLMGFDRDGARATANDRARVKAAIVAMEAERDIIVEMAVKDGERWRRDVVIKKRTRLLDELDNKSTGEKEWLIHASLAIGYNTGAVFLDQSAWTAGLRAIGGKELTDPMKWADVYLKNLALPGLMEAKREAKRTKVPVTAAGFEKNLTLSTLWDRFGIPSTMEAIRKKRGFTGAGGVHTTIETLLAFCVGSHALLAWKPWYDAAGAVKGYTVRMPAPSGALTDESETALELPFDFSQGMA